MRRPTRAQVGRVVRHPALRSPRLAAGVARREAGRVPATRGARCRAWAIRLPVLARALARPLAAGDVDSVAALAPVLAGLVDLADPSEVWLALAVLSGELPTEEVVVEVARRGALDHGEALAAAVARSTTLRSARARVVVTDATLLDLDHTIGADFTTGIQRVVRETARRWLAADRCEPVAWVEGHWALRPLTGAERAVARGEAGDASGVRAGDAAVTPGRRHTTVVVPWGGRYLLPELALELSRLERTRALVRFSRVHSAAIGFDCVPITSAETVALGIGHFARYLSVLKHVDRVAPISQAAGQEFLGWRAMLAGTGLPGPQVSPVLLPAQAPSDDPALDQAVRAELAGDGRPVVLVVGSHEPRKNHLAVLHAAELLWRRGLDFRLALVGGRGWGSEPFYDRVEELRAAGRPIVLPRDVDDARLFAAYRVARFTVFPSLNEGYGLPVAESLACGTPVVTSAFGSMAEIAAQGGALTVDPRDDHDLARAMERLLRDDELLDRLRSEARCVPRRSWDDYAAQLWATLAGQ